MTAARQPGDDRATTSALHGRTVLITGGSSGIGAATARLLAQEGCRLILVGRDCERLDEIAASTGARSVVADLSTPAGVDAVIDAGRAADLLINNAGAGWAGNLDELTAQHTDALTTVNFSVPVQLTRALLPAMMERGHGHLVFVSSIAAIGVRGEAVYAASKAALRTFAASVRYESVSRGVGVTTVLPGAVSTPFFEVRGSPYERRFPQPVTAEKVARGLVDGVLRDRHEVFVPRWLTVPARLQGAMPTTFHRLARRFG